MTSGSGVAPVPDVRRRELGSEHGLAEACVITCDNIITVPIDDLERVGRLDDVARARLDHALRYALDIVY